MASDRIGMMGTCPAGSRRQGRRYSCLLLASLLIGASACSTVVQASGTSSAIATTSVPVAPTTTIPTTTTATLAPAAIRIQPPSGTVGVRPDSVFTAEVGGGELVGLRLLSGDGSVVPSTVTGSTLRPNHPLTFGKTFRVEATARNPQGATTRAESDVTVLSPEAPVDVTVYPSEGDIVGIGMPVIIWFSETVAPEARDAVVARLRVTSSPPVEGAWRWISGDTLHWRPRVFWPAGTNIRVENSLVNTWAGEDRWFGEVATRSYRIGEAKRLVIDAESHHMTALVNEQPVRVIPISTGSDRFPTASGIDLIMEKHDEFEMDSASVGLTGADAYRLTVSHAQRLTNSGTFIHAAPWNGSLGYANLSHGCINASTRDAAWTLDFTQIGDPVEVVNTPVRVDYDNGWGDWNLSFEEWAAAG